jgi:hypothetical protein
MNNDGSAQVIAQQTFAPDSVYGPSTSVSAKEAK